MAKAKTSSKLMGGTAAKAWKLAKAGTNYKVIGEMVGYTASAIKLYVQRKYMEEATKLWADDIKKVGHCEIPGCTRGNLNAHHLLEKSTWTHLRCDPSNGVCLCSYHHTHSNEIAAHGPLPATEAFIEWLKADRSGQYAWYQENKDDKSFHDIDFEKVYEELTQ